MYDSTCHRQPPETANHQSTSCLLTLPACQEEYPASCILPDLDPTQTQTDCLHAQAPPTDGDYQEEDGGDAEEDDEDRPAPCADTLQDSLPTVRSLVDAAHSGSSGRTRFALLEDAPWRALVLPLHSPCPQATGASPCYWISWADRSGASPSRQTASRRRSAARLWTAASTTASRCSTPCRMTTFDGVVTPTDSDIAVRCRRDSSNGCALA